jgi:hypothetical protein
MQRPLSGRDHLARPAREALAGKAAHGAIGRLRGVLA